LIIVTAAKAAGDLLFPALSRPGFGPGQRAGRYQPVRSRTALQCFPGTRARHMEACDHVNDNL